MSLFKQRIQTKSKPIIFGLCLSVMSFHSAGLTTNQKPVRANDLSYGSVLYEYHQGNAFEALSLLNVAKEKGGIIGHGEHPDLVEGGLLLSYGLTYEAKKIFENLLKKKLKISDRNLAWFYLGKVFFLEQNFSESIDSFDKINLGVLVKKDKEKFYELIYLVSQIESLNIQNKQTDLNVMRRLGVSVNALPKHHIYHYYINYNDAVSLVATDKLDTAIENFKQLIASLFLEKQKGAWRKTEPQGQTQTASTGSVDLAMEFKALYNQSLLSLGQLYLQNNQNELAFNTLKQVDKGSVFSDNALFAYAISASNLSRHDVALSALTKLNEQALFNPWQQQTPYALAYLYEKLNEPVLALEAYRAAVANYEALQETLNNERLALTEETLLTALNIQHVLGSEALEKDAYGRINSLNSHFSFSQLLATEKFQRQLSELHELYLVKNSMQRWDIQLASFQDILETRLLSRQAKLQSTKTDLASKKANLWNAKEKEFQEQIHKALEQENAYFFMTEEQISYFNRIKKAKNRLLSLPDKHPKKVDYTRRFERAKAYFEWWIRDDFSVNRWQAQKELKLLQKEMQIFRGKYKLLNAEKELDDTHLQFIERVDSGKARLAVLKKALEKSLEHSSQQLLLLVDMAMQDQLLEIAQYLLASREALARVSDDLLVKGKIRYTHSSNTPPEPTIESTSTTEESNNKDPKMMEAKP